MSSSHYCVWGLCNPKQNCCGDNVCCDETEFNSLLLTAIVSGILLTIALLSICFYCRRRRIYAPILKKYLRITYLTISSEHDSTTNLTTNQEPQTNDCTLHINKTAIT